MSRNVLPTLPFNLPATPKRPTSTYIRRTAQYAAVGEPAARPCPHALTTWDEIRDPVQGLNWLTRRTINRCERTGGHDRAENSAHRSGRKEW